MILEVISKLIKFKVAAVDFIDKHAMIGGGGSSFAGVAISFISGLETGLRIFGLALGCAIGILTLYIKWKNKDKQQNDS